MSIAQTSMLASHSVRLQDLERSVQGGNAAILARLDHPAFVSNTSLPANLQVKDTQEVARTGRSERKSFSRFRISLPAWLVQRAWEFGVRASENGWEFRIHPVTLRPNDSFAFQVVESGSVSAVRKLLTSGELALRDQLFSQNACNSLLEVRQ